MKSLYIFKVGTTFPATQKMLGDFDSWTITALGPLPLTIKTLALHEGAALPPIDDCAGIIITGSHAMVTDKLSWSTALEKWLPQLVDANIPLLGVCYGHQIIAEALGGKVDFHPQGKEVGIVNIELLSSCDTDPLFQNLPQVFPAHTTHAQTVLQLPTNATRLAFNLHDPHHAFRVGTHIWGVQFHPEYTPAIMRNYITEQRGVLEAAGEDVPALLADAKETTSATEVLHRFGQLVVDWEIKLTV